MSTAWGFAGVPRPPVFPTCSVPWVGIRRMMRSILLHHVCVRAGIVYACV